ncbi:MAG: hypothetical protein NZ519_04660 [Bacteroidia bacterium]|nr:hypothetical protein [Bacteroidia bacterium]
MDLVCFFCVRHAKGVRQHGAQRSVVRNAPTLASARGTPKKKIICQIFNSNPCSTL